MIIEMYSGRMKIEKSTSKSIYYIYTSAQERA